MTQPPKDPANAGESGDRPLKTEEMTLDQMLIQYAARIRKAAHGDNPIRDAGIAREQVRTAIEANYVPKPTDKTVATPPVQGDELAEEQHKIGMKNGRFGYIPKPATSIKKMIVSRDSPEIIVDEESPVQSDASLHRVDIESSSDELDGFLMLNMGTGNYKRLPEHYQVKLKAAIQAQVDAVHKSGYDDGVLVGEANLGGLFTQAQVDAAKESSYKEGFSDGQDSLLNSGMTGLTLYREDEVKNMVESAYLQGRADEGSTCDQESKHQIAKIVKSGSDPRPNLFTQAQVDEARVQSYRAGLNDQHPNMYTQKELDDRVDEAVREARIDEMNILARAEEHVEDFNMQFNAQLYRDNRIKQLTTQSKDREEK